MASIVLETAHGIIGIHGDKFRHLLLTQRRGVCATRRKGASRWSFIGHERYSGRLLLKLG
jgi:hypothetical protein